MELIFEVSKAGRSAVEVPQSDVPEVNIEKVIGKKYLRDNLDLPEVAEVDLVRHYTNLSRRNFGVDLGFYPLGSCTMKYNPKVNERRRAPRLHRSSSLRCGSDGAGQSAIALRDAANVE